MNNNKGHEHPLPHIQGANTLKLAGNKDREIKKIDNDNQIHSKNKYHTN